MNLSVKFVQDMDLAISVMRNAGKWLLESGRDPSKWWQLQNLNREFLLQHVEPDEFYVALIDGKPAAAEILQETQDVQEWKSFDKNNSPKVLYIHWLCVARQFASQGLPKVMIDFATKKAKEKGLSLLRADTNAQETKLREIYESLGFQLIGIVREDYRNTAFYEKIIS